MEHSGKLKIVDELDPSQNYLEAEDLTKFLSEFDHTYMNTKSPNRPDYIIMDDFASAFDNINLLGAKSEV